MPTKASPVRPRRRLTQPERSAATREALVDSTITCLIELGFEGATTTEICERAGLSRGAHLHHFHTRSALLAAAVVELADRGTEQLRAAVAELPTGRDRHEAALDMVWSLFRGPLFTMLLELSVRARTDEELRASLGPVERFVGPTAVGHMRLAFAGAPDDRRADESIALILATARGLAVMLLLDEASDVARYWATCRAELLRSLRARRKR